MNEKKLKSAFKKIKTEMETLRIDIKSLKNKSGKKSMENSKNIDVLRSDFETLTKKVKNIKIKPQKNIEDIKIIEDKFELFQEMILGKLNMEISSLKLELNSSLDIISSNISNLKKDFDKKQIPNKDMDTKVQNTFSDFSEIIDEKMNLEINSLKLEFTEEIGKLYDRFFLEVVEFKNELNKLQDKPLEKKSKSNLNKNKSEIKSKKKSELKIENKIEDLEEKPKKEGKLKKVAKWLFVDEEEDFEDLKDEIKKGE